MFARELNKTEKTGDSFDGFLCLQLEQMLIVKFIQLKMMMIFDKIQKKTHQRKWINLSSNICGTDEDG